MNNNKNEPKAIIRALLFLPLCALIAVLYVLLCGIAFVRLMLGRPVQR